ncbi:hypothetical protein NL676_005384 [Syzygium grande]|nr:hypothetical protein NL676_005384 [Syzygium grande]
MEAVNPLQFASKLCSKMRRPELGNFTKEKKKPLIPPVFLQILLFRTSPGLRRRGRLSVDAVPAAFGITNSIEL